MSQPSPYNRQTSFSNYQAGNPSRPLPGNTLDAELNAVKVTLDEILDNLALIQRDDGGVANDSIGLDQLSEEVEVGWEAPTVWVTGTAYSGNQTVFHGSGFYRLLVDHTAGTFATDLAADKWELIVDLSDLTIVDASQIANTPSGSIAATTVQAAIDELASEKAASSHTHPASAISDSTGPGRTLLTAASAAAQRTALELGALALEDTVPVDEIGAQIAFTGIIEPAALASNINDWSPTGLLTASTIRLSASANNVQITGLLAPAADGDIKILENVGTTYAVTLPPASASSAAANRFLFSKPVVIGPNAAVALKYDLDGTSPGWRLLSSPSRLPRGWIDGLVMSNGTDTTNDINVSAGECRGTRGILDLVLTTALTGKQLDADWAAGSAAGMRYSGAAIANTTYHIFLIGKADGTTDVFAYAGGTDPTSVLPSGYIDYRRIGSIVRSSGSIVQFTQYPGGEFRLASVVRDVNSNPIGATAIAATLSVPTGIKIRAAVTAGLYHSGAALGLSSYALISSLDQADVAASASAYTNYIPGSNDNANDLFLAADTVIAQVRTNTSGQVRYRLSGSNANIYYTIQTHGWFDDRGRDD